MTERERDILRRLVDEARRQRVLSEEDAHGADTCAFCARVIREPRPRRRFCSENCRKRAGDRDGRGRRLPRAVSHHGTESAYKQARCRCDACRAANAEAVAKARARIKTEIFQGDLRLERGGQL